MRKEKKRKPFSQLRKKTTWSDVAHAVGESGGILKREDADGRKRGSFGKKDRLIPESAGGVGLVKDSQ